MRTGKKDYCSEGIAFVFAVMGNWAVVVSLRSVYTGKHSRQIISHHSCTIEEWKWIIVFWFGRTPSDIL